MQAQSNADTKPLGEQLKLLNKQMMVLQSQMLDEATPQDVLSQLEKQSEEYVSMLIAFASTEVFGL